jgi:hypothetical protein
MTRAPAWRCFLTTPDSGARLLALLASGHRHGPITRLITPWNIGELGVVKDNWTAQLTGSNLSNSDAATNISAARWIKATIPLRPRVLMLTMNYRSERRACGHRQQACPHLAP